MSANGLKAVLFDLDGTLRHNHPPGIDLVHRLAAEHGLRVDPRRQREAKRWVHAYWADSVALRRDLRLAAGDREGLYLRFLRRHLRRLGATEAQAAAMAPPIHRWMVEHYRPEDHVPEEVPRTLERLRRAGYRLGVLSNRDRPLEPTLEALALDGWFEVAVAAGRLGAWKPDPRPFREAVGRLGVPAQAVVYVGDNYYADVLGARAVGLRPVLLDPEGLFPEADCPVVASLAELPELLAGAGGAGAWLGV